MKKKKFIKNRRRQASVDDSEFATNYEKYVNLLGGYRKQVYSHISSERDKRAKMVSRAKGALKRGMLTAQKRRECKNIVSVTGQYSDIPTLVLARVEDPLKSSHLFMMGPATSESLFGFKPDDYQFIKNGRLPFDNCYFELVDSLDVKLPGLSLDASLEGVQISHRGKNYLSDALKAVGEFDRMMEEDPDFKDIAFRDYDITAFMNMKDHGVGIFRMEFEVLSKKMHNWAELRLPHFKDRIVYHGSPQDTQNDLEEMNFEIRSFSHNYEPVPFCHGRGDEVNFGAIEIGDANVEKASQFIESLYGFGVNMINYVNSHNVTISRRDFGGPSSGNRQKNVHSKPYNLITLRDEERYVAENPVETGRELKYRIYVRGHPRRFRDDDGVIRKTSWVSPHVKGPKNAPWREQRYQVLAAKLEREKKFDRMIKDGSFSGVKDF